MKKITFTLLCFLVLSPILYAQASKIMTASISLKEGNYKLAIEQATEGLKGSYLKNKDLAKGNYVIGSALMFIHSNHFKSANAKNYAELVKQLDEVYPNILQRMVESFDLCEKYDDRSSYKGNLAKNRSGLYGLFIQESVGALNEQKFDLAMTHINKAIDLIKKVKPAVMPYNVFYLKGFIELNLQTTAHSTQALEDFEKSLVYLQALKDHIASKDGDPNMLPFDGHLPKVYAQIINLYLNHKGDIDKAMEVTETAKALYPDSKNGAEILAKEREIYKKPGMFEKALNKYQAQLKTNPNDTTVLGFLGSLYMSKADIAFTEADTLLKQSLVAKGPLQAQLKSKYESAEKAAMEDFTTAENYMLDAIKINPNYYQGNVLIAVLYNNRGTYLQDQLYAVEDELSDDAFDDMKDEIKSYNTKAIVYFEVLVRLNKDNIEAVKALRDLYSAVGKTKESETYSTKYDEMMKAREKVQADLKKKSGL